MFRPASRPCEILLRAAASATKASTPFTRPQATAVAASFASSSSPPVLLHPTTRNDDDRGSTSNTASRENASNRSSLHSKARTSSLKNQSFKNPREEGKIRHKPSRFHRATPRSSKHSEGKQHLSLAEGIQELEERTYRILQPQQTRPPHESSSRPVAMEALWHEWNSTLKHVHDVTRLRGLVELVDQLVRHNHDAILLTAATVSSTTQAQDENDVSSSPTPSLTSRDELLAVYVGISAWARVSSFDPNAAKRAQQLFELLSVPIFVPTDLQPNFVRHRRNVYQALLLAWSRSSSIPTHHGESNTTTTVAASRCRYWLDQMKREEKKYSFQHRLVNVHSYNSVISAYASLGDIATVEELIEELKARRCHLNAVTYDNWIKVYQVYNNRLHNDREASEQVTSKALEIFRHQLEQYRLLLREQVRHHNHASLQPLPLTLGRILAMFNRHNDKRGPDRAKSTLEFALAFEQDHPDCIGLVDRKAFCRVMQAYTSHNRVEEAEQVLSQLLQLYQETSTHPQLRPTSMAFGIVLDGYAQRKTLESLTKVEDIVNTLEDKLIRSRPDVLTNSAVPHPRTDHLHKEEDYHNQHHSEVKCGVYNILMTSYLRNWPRDAVESIRATLDRMEGLAQQYDLPELRPDSISYTILMKALVKEGREGYLHQVETILTQMQADPRQETRPQLQTYTVALDAWAKSGEANAVAKIREILGMMDSPDTTCYNVVLNALAKQGFAHEALQLLEQMKSDYKSGRNRLCRPDNITYSSVLHALASYSTHDHNDDLSRERWIKALQCFDDMLGSYRQGDEDCRPSQETIATLLHVLQLCSEVPNKHIAAGGVLTRLNQLDLQQGSTTALALILACGETMGSEESKRESAMFAVGVLKSLGSGATPVMFQAALEACDKLLDHRDEKDSLASDVFKLCAASGNVTRELLLLLQKICSPDKYLLLTSQDARKPPNFCSIPEEWKRRAGR